MSKAERVEVLVDLIRGDAEAVTGGMHNMFEHNGRTYWVLTDTERADEEINSEEWHWVGQLGLTHVYRMA